MQQNLVFPLVKQRSKSLNCRIPKSIVERLDNPDSILFKMVIKEMNNAFSMFVDEKMHKIEICLDYFKSLKHYIQKKTFGKI